MIADQNDHILELGIRRVLKFRKQETETNIRLFNITTIDFDAKACYKLIGWQNVQITPPLLLDVTDDKIERVIIESTFLKITIELTSARYLTQLVETMTKLVSAAFSKICGHKNKDGYIRTTLRSLK